MRARPQRRRTQTTELSSAPRRSQSGSPFCFGRQAGSESQRKLRKARCSTGNITSTLSRHRRYPRHGNVCQDSTCAPGNSGEECCTGLELKSVEKGSAQMESGNGARQFRPHHALVKWGVALALLSVLVVGSLFARST